MRPLPFAQSATLVEMPPHRRLWPALIAEPDAALERTRQRAIRALQRLEECGPHLPDQPGDFAADVHTEWTALLAELETALARRAG